MLRLRATFEKINGKVLFDGPDPFKKLKDGEYSFLCFDQSANRELPIKKYLFGVLLPQVQSQLTQRLSIDQLFEYFVHTLVKGQSVQVDMEWVEYKSMRTASKEQWIEFVDNIKNYVKQKWNIDIIESEEVCKSEAVELWANAYTEQWKNILNN